MPKYKSKQASKPALFGFLALFLSLAIHQPIYLTVVVGIVLLVIIWGKFEQSKIEEYFYTLCADRKGRSICEFAREFEAGTVDTWIIRATYEQLQAARPTTQ